VRFRDEALQLLLIIDHIFDWARDQYRPSILRHIKSLSKSSSTGTMTDSDDSDIWSLRSPVENLAKGSPREQTPDIVELSETPEIFRTSRPPYLLDSPRGAFRYGSTIVSEFSALLITGDSANTMLQSFATEARAKLYARKALKALVERTEVVRLTGQSLGKLEHLWTGESEIPANSVISATSFYTITVVKIGLTADWHQVRHLCCLAVSEDAFGVLAQFSGLRHLPKPKVFSCQQETLLDLFRVLRSASADSTLRASIRRLALGLQVRCASNADGSAVPIGGRPWIPAPGFTENRGRWFGLAMIGYCHLVQEVVYEVYKRHKIGRREPSEVFIRRSTGSDEQSPKPHSTKTTFPFLPKLKYVANGIVVVVGHCENPKTETPASICIFTFSKNPGEQRRKMIKILEKVDLFDRAIYQTRRHGPNKSVRSKESNMIDNRTTARKDFYKHLQELIAYLQREEGSYLHALPEQRQLTLAEAVTQLVQPAPSDAQTRDSCVSAGSLQSPTSRFFKRHEQAWAILTRPGGLDYLCAHCIKALLTSGHSTLKEIVTVFAKTIRDWNSDLDDDLKTEFTAVRHPFLEENVNRLLYAIMSEHGVSGIRLLLLLKELRNVNAPKEDSPLISDSEDCRLIEGQRLPEERALVLSNQAGSEKAALESHEHKLSSQTSPSTFVDLTVEEETTDVIAASSDEPAATSPTSYNEGQQPITPAVGTNNATLSPSLVAMNDASRALLMGMGFKASWCRVALDTCGKDDPQLAIEWLVQQSEFAGDPDQVDLGDHGNGSPSLVAISDHQSLSEQLAWVHE